VPALRLRLDRVRLDGPNRNFWLGVNNGVFITGAETFFHSGLVLAPFLAALGAPAWAIGMIPALKVGGWFLPQLFVASRLAHHEYKLPVYRRTSMLRSVALAIMVVAAFFAADHPGPVVTIMLVMIAINSVAGGVGGVPFADVTAKVVPHYRLGSFWALRNAIGGILALLCGLVLRRVLDAGLAFPTDFGVVFVLGFALSIAAYVSFALVREPPGVPSTKEPLWSMLRRIPGVFRRDVPFRRYLRVRFLALAAFMAEPFYGVYAISVLEAPLSAIGTLLIISTTVAILANFAFRGPANRAQNTTIIHVSLVCLVAAPIVAMLAGEWQWFALVFALSAVGSAGMGIAVSNLLYAIAPSSERPLYIGVANSVLSIPSLAPIAVGALVPFAGFGVAFVAAAVAAALALAFSFRFGELRAIDRAALERSTA
jgi:hypothetical protein